MARKFKFRLAPVLKYRETIEDEAKNRFSHITQVRNVKADELDLVKEDQAKASAAMIDHKVGNIDTGALRHLNRYMTGLGVTERQKSGELQMIDREVEKRRVEFVEARKDVRVMEKLKDKKREAHEYEVTREETRVFDELALQRMRQEAEAEQARLAQMARKAANGGE